MSYAEEDKEMEEKEPITMAGEEDSLPVLTHSRIHSSRSVQRQLPADNRPLVLLNLLERMCCVSLSHGRRLIDCASYCSSTRDQLVLWK